MKAVKKYVFIQDQEIYKYKENYFHSKAENYFSKYLSVLSEESQLYVVTSIKEIYERNVADRYFRISHKRIKYIKIPDYRNPTNYFKIKKTVEKTVRKAELCFLRCGIASLIATKACIKNNIRYIAIVNEDLQTIALGNKRNTIKATSFPLYLGQRFIVKNATAALYVTKNYLQKKYPCYGKTLGCSDVTGIMPDNDIQYCRIRRIRRTSNKLIIGSIGSPDVFLKGHDIVIKAIHQIKKKGYHNLLFQIVGPGEGYRIRKLASKYSVDENVQLLGELSKEDVNEWLDSIDIYVHPSRSEGLPRAIIEAMSKGLPCIGSNAGGIPELLEKECMFNYKSIDSNKRLARIICFMMDKDILEKYSIINFEKSKEFSENIIDIKRMTFIRDVIR